MNDNRIKTLKKDSYGNEIYLGDILITDEDPKDSCLVYLNSKENKIVMREKNRKTEYNFWIDHLNTRVIGNIYDNPELFKERIKQ